MTKKIELTQEIVRELLDYDPETGLLFWKERHVKWFKDGKRTAQKVANSWNAKNSGKLAFTSLCDGYYTGGIFGKIYKAHRIIWLIEFGFYPDEIDHENGLTWDNRLSNLRESNRFDNMKNLKKYSHNTTGFTGVYSLKDNKWRALITVEGKRKHLGYFKT